MLLFSTVQYRRPVCILCALVQPRHRVRTFQSHFASFAARTSQTRVCRREGCKHVNLREVLLAYPIYTQQQSCMVWTESNALSNTCTAQRRKSLTEKDGLVVMIQRSHQLHQICADCRQVAPMLHLVAVVDIVVMMCTVSLVGCCACPTDSWKVCSNL